MIHPAAVERPRGFSPAEISGRVNLSVVEEQRDDAAQLWLLRTHAVGSPHYLLDDIAELDARLEADLEGMLLAGEAGLELARAGLEGGGPGELFGFTALAIARAEPASFDHALAVAEDPELAPGFEHALAWLPFAWVEPCVRALIDAADPRLARAALIGHASARVDLGPRLASLCMAEDSSLRVRALQAVGELGRVDLVPLVEQVLQLAPDQATQLAGVEALVQLAPPSPSVQATLWSDMIADHEHAQRSAWLSGRCLSPTTGQAWYAKLLESPAHRHLAITLAGALGDVARVDDLIGLMHAPALARAAGAALRTITGVDLAYLDLDADAPEGFVAGPSDDPDDEAVALDPEEDLPWPDPELVGRWWAEQRERFAVGVRLLGGAPVGPSTCWDQLARAPQLLRRAAAFELARIHPNQPSFAIEGPAPRQRRWLARASVA